MNRLPPQLRNIALGFGAIILALLIFHAGVVVGAHRARFGPRVSDRGFRAPFFPAGFSLPHTFIRNDHGAIGQVATVTPPTFTLATRDGAAETIVMGTTTLIHDASGTATTTLTKGETVVVLGEPDAAAGRIDARVIRILSSPSP